MLQRASLVAFFLVLMPATVEAFDHHHHHHASSGGDGCGSSSSDAPESDPSTSPPPASATVKRVFVTSSSYSGALGGLPSADAQCQSRAIAHGLPGVFRAWLSDATTNAYDRMADVGPWYTASNELAFATKADLLGAPRSDLLDELGGYPEGPGAKGAWSGSDAAGVASGKDCDGWTNATANAQATTGTALGSDATWGGGSAPLRCDGKAPLICFQQ
jgi:hypothetical protein